MIERRIREFCKCIESHRFYEAHEVLEALWFPRRFEQESEVKLLKGFINAAVSFELLKRGRKAQSERVWQNYLKYRSHLQHLHTHPHHQDYTKLADFLEMRKISLTAHYCAL